MNTILIKNINLINDDNLDILIEGGIIKKIGKELKLENNSPLSTLHSPLQTIEGNGKLTAMPPLFDMHVHLRDPGQTHKEDILTGCAAALKGGITGLVAMPNTSPCLDNAESINYVKEKSAQTGVSVYPAACITKNMAGLELSDFADFANLGVKIATDDGKPVESAEMMRAALLKSAQSGILIASHCEDLRIVNGGIINKGGVSERLGVLGIDRAAEDIITARDIKLAEETGARVHICHVSTRGSFELIRQAKSRGVRVTCETCPHYFYLTEEELLKLDADYRMNPPLRTEDDRQAAIKAVIDGTVDCIVTDHAPHTAAEKADFYTAPNGVVGLETSLAVTLTAFYHTAKLGLRKITELMSISPRKILGLPIPEIKEGAKADLILVDLHKNWVVDTKNFHSKSKNSPFKGKALKGENVVTIVNGEIRYS